MPERRLYAAALAAAAGDVHPGEPRAELAATGHDAPPPAWQWGAATLVFTGVCLLLFRRRAAS